VFRPPWPHTRRPPPKSRRDFGPVTANESRGGESPMAKKKAAKKKATKKKAAKKKK
jgi:hypothetical protein